MQVHHYRITVDALEPGGEGTESVSFFATMPNDIFGEVTQLRNRLGCSACAAAKLALGRGLIGEVHDLDHTPSLSYR